MRRSLPLVLVIACGPVDVDPGGTSTSETGDTSETGAVPTTGSETTGGPLDMGGAEQCLAVHYPGDLWTGPLQLTCDAAELCAGEGRLWFRLEGVDFFEPDYDAATAAETNELERARCLARALRDRTPGQFLFAPILGDDTPYLFGREIVGELVVERGEANGCKLLAPEPVGCHVNERLRVLRPPEFFAGCVDGDALALWRCLFDAFAPEPECVAGPLTCP